MKRLILIGGKPGKSGDDNALAYALCTHSADELHVAFCNYARTDMEWDDTDNDSIELFNRFCANKKLAFKTMSTDSFMEVSKWADVIYMPGGDPSALKTALDNFPDLPRLWDGKVIAGSSAGADVMCAQFVYLQNKTVGVGFGWVKATCIPHWGHYEGYADKDWDLIRSAALQRRPDLPVLCIPEGQIVEFAVQ